MSEITSVNPATGESIRAYQAHSDRDVGEILQRTAKVQRSWSQESFSSRSALMSAAARILRERAGRYAELMADEMGKPISQGRSEIEKCAWVCDYYAAEAEGFLSSERIATDASDSFVAYRPLGVVLAVMPWNFPFWQVFRFAAPNLMAGNAGVLKHASNVPGCALAIEDVFREAGFPQGVFRTLMIGSDQVARVIEDPAVRAVTLTGSTAAGKAVAANAGRALKKTVLELGGSDPYVILEDADVDHAAEICVTSRLINSGQSCIAAKRFIVVEAVRERFEAAFVAKMAARTTGDPRSEATDVGPQARHDLRDALHRQVLGSIEQGADCLLGGQIPDSGGAYYPPTVLTDVRRGMPAFDDELFGPVAAVVPVADEEDAVRAANDSVFGLGAAVFTQDLDRGKRIAEESLEAGSCFVNGFVKSDPRLPFGGLKESGYGRELGRHGILEFVNAKTVWIK